MDYLAKVPHITDLILDVLLGNNDDNPMNMIAQHYPYLSIYPSQPGLDKLTHGIIW